MENVIRNVKPQVVMVELDAQRIGGFLEEEKQARSCRHRFVVRGLGVARAEPAAVNGLCLSAVLGSTAVPPCFVLPGQRRGGFVADGFGTDCFGIGYRGYTRAAGHIVSFFCRRLYSVIATVRFGARDEAYL